MRGIILAGGSGTRLYPLTVGICKQLLPIYSKPMIYYPLSVLMLAGIKEILIITTPEAIPLFVKLLGKGQHLGISIEYAIQERPVGLADAFLIGEKFIGEENVCLILGDNIFYGNNFTSKLQEAQTFSKGAKVFAYQVNNARQYGVIEFGDSDKVVSIEEKPEHPKSNYALTGIYFFDQTVVAKAKTTQPSPRGELEIVDVIKQYLEEDSCYVEKLGKGTCWFDTGTHESLNDAANFVGIIEKRQGHMIACLEEIAYQMGYITGEELKKLVNRAENSTYSQYLNSIELDS